MYLLSQKRFCIRIVLWIYISGQNLLCEAKRGFILTAPKALDAGSNEYITFTAFEVPNGGRLSLKLLHWYTDDVLSQSTIQVLSGLNMWVEMTIPPTSEDVRAKLRVEGTFSDGYKIEAEKEVLIRHDSAITLVQTDKPIYKPGQTVKFRVMPMDCQLKPLISSEIDLWVEDPTGIRVAQWRQVKFPEGMKQFELPLSKEPPIGTWIIKSVLNQVTHTQKFNVEKYVLPKFDVVINSHPYALIGVNTIPVEICARYTYGKNVHGLVDIRVNYLNFRWLSSRKREPQPIMEFSRPISGCETISINIQDIIIQYPQILEAGYQIISILAEVKENGTEIVRNSSKTVELKRFDKELAFFSTGDGMDYFKPGIPFFGQVETKRPDGRSVGHEKIQLCAEYYRNWGNADRRCHVYTSNKKGHVKFTLPPRSLSITRINLKAELLNQRSYKSDRPVVASMRLKSWYSSSQSYLQIQPLFSDMECDKLHKIKIRYTAAAGENIKFYHQIQSRGRIVQQGSHQRTFRPKSFTAVPHYDLESSLNEDWVNGSNPPLVGEFVLNVEPRAPMSPIARLLVYYVRQDGELIADAKVFKVTHCLNNKVNVHFRHEQQYPGTDAYLLLSASPASLCGITMTDKSVSLLTSENHFNTENIFKALEAFDIGKNNKPQQITSDFCLQKNVDPSAHDSPELKPPHRSKTFMRSIHSDSSSAFEEAGIVVITSFKVETRPCEDNFPPGTEDPIPYMASSFKKNRGRRPNQIMNPEEPDVAEIRSYFPDTWLWEMHRVGSSGEFALKKLLPDSVTEWVGGAVCVHPEFGLGLSTEATITTFRPFFLSLQLPYSVVRGEKLPLVVSVFNYLTECLPIKLSLQSSTEYEILSDMRSQKVCVCGGESATRKFLLKPTALGVVNVTMYGYSIEDDDLVCGNEVTARLRANDAVTKQLLIEAEGFPYEEVFNYFVCPEKTNGTFATEVDLLLPENVIEGSARGFISVTGDLMGPAMEGLSRLVKQPFGCGEQNMVSFTPNIFVLDYLTARGGLTKDLENRCLDNMKTGYQRELLYRHKDGSYSAFGSKDDEGSLWLTSFVIRSFGQARRFLEIDEHDLRLSSAWIVRKQLENGCFRRSGLVIHKAMKGGLKDDEDENLGPLTAYVLISLLESGIQRPEQSAVRSAIRCLESEPSSEPYTLALYAYAHALAIEPAAANRFLKQLEDKADMKDRMMFWLDSSGSKGVNVEIAGYYTLALLHLKGREGVTDALPIIRWIIQQRNANGGLVSTQDTIVALQALSRHASLQPLSSLDMGLVVEGDDLVKGFKLDPENHLLTQTVHIPVLPAILELQAVGDGCALIQFSLQCNTMNKSRSSVFDLNVEAVRQELFDCRKTKLNICMRYKITDQTSNMIVLSIKIASGYIPHEDSLYQLQSDKTVRLKRFEIDVNLLNLYFDELSNDQKCFKFFIQEELEVEDIQPSTIQLFDYYQPEYEITKEYTIPSVCSEDTDSDLPLLPPLHSDQIFDITESTIKNEMLSKNLEDDSTTSKDEIDTTHIIDLKKIFTTETASQKLQINYTIDSGENFTIESTTDSSHEFSSTYTINSEENFTIDSNSDSSHYHDDANEMGTKDPIYENISKWMDSITTVDENTSSETVSIKDNHFTTSLYKTFFTDASTENTFSWNYSTDGNVGFENTMQTDLTNVSDLKTELLTENATHWTISDTNEISTVSDWLTTNDNYFEHQEHEKEMTAVSGLSDENAGSDTNFLDYADEDSLSNFIDVDHELGFPDGVEGNIPVSVLPPQTYEVNFFETTELETLLDCPICLSDFPENFTDIYCNSSFVLRVIVEEDLVTLLEDISPQLFEFQSLNEKVELDYDNQCNCSQINKDGTSHLILGASSHLWQKSIRLNDQVVVIAANNMTTSIQEFRNRCTVEEP